MRIPLKTGSGITLVEVVISVMLIAIAVVSILSTVTQSSVFSKRIDMAYTAAYLAQRRIDLLKEFDFDQLYPGAAEENVEIDIDDDGDTDYRRTTEVTQGYSGYAKLVKIKVIVEKMKIGLNGLGSVVGDPVTMETVIFAGFDETA